MNLRLKALAVDMIRRAGWCRLCAAMLLIVATLLVTLGLL